MSIYTDASSTTYVDGTLTRTTHSCTYRSCAQCPHRCVTHHANTRGSRAPRIAHCGVSKTTCHPSVMSHMLPLLSLTLLQDLSHLPQHSSDHLLPHCLVLRTWIKKPCEIHGGVPDVLNVHLPQHKWPKSWSNIEDPVVPLERNLYARPLAGLLWERQFEEVLLGLDGLKYRKDCSYRCVWMTSQSLEENRIWFQCGRN